MWNCRPIPISFTDTSTEINRAWFLKQVYTSSYVTLSLDNYFVDQHFNNRVYGICCSSNILKQWSIDSQGISAPPRTKGGRAKVKQEISEDNVGGLKWNEIKGVEKKRKRHNILGGRGAGVVSGDQNIHCWKSVVLCLMMWSWCWLRRVPIGCYPDLSGASNSTGRNVGCWRSKPALGARKCLSLWATKSPDAGVNGEWARGRLQALQFLWSWWPRTSAFLLRLVAATPRLL